MAAIPAFVQVLGFSLAAVALVTAGGAVSAPDLAPELMTMGTMDRAFDITGYEDTGHCDFWVLNLTYPLERIERSFPCGFAWDWSDREEGVARVHEVLYDHEQADVFQVPHLPHGRMEEWYRVDEHMLTEDALQFQLQADPDPGVLMPPPGARGNLTMGWIESSGRTHGQEHLVAARDLQEVGVETVEGLEVVHWTSTLDRVETTWHGYELLLSEEVHLWSDPQTAWILQMERHVLVEMTPRQMVQAFGYQLPLEDGEPREIMELEYRTVPEGRADHAEETTFFRQLMAPLEAWPSIAAVSGLASLGFVGLGVAGRTLRRAAG